jgi:glycosyltransferase involved in cell wall biosynthesis
MHRVKPDLVYSRYLQGCILPALAGRRFVFESHAPMSSVSKFWSGSLRFLASTGRLEALVVISEALRKTYLEQDFPVSGGGIVVAHDASSAVRGNGRRSQWPGRAGSLQVGYVGQLYPGKGMEIVERVAFKLPHLDFHVIGGLERDLTAWKSKGMGPNVIFHGFVSQEELSGYINCLDVCLLPNQRVVQPYTRKRGKAINIGDYCSPLKMFDYMAHGKAIVASDLPVLREILNESNAVLVDPEDVGAWSMAIESLRDAGRRESIGRKARMDFLENHTWDARASFLIGRIRARTEPLPAAA